MPRLRRRHFIEFYRGIPQSIQANFKLYDVDGHRAAGEADTVRTNDLLRFEQVAFEDNVRVFQAAVLLGHY